MINFFARHPTAPNLLMIGLLVIGLLSVGQLQRETFPDITPSEVQVRVIYPGATAQEVEEVICQRIEDAVDGVRFVKELRADARVGLATVVAEMTEGGNFTTFLADIESEVEAIDDFPDDVETAGHHGPRTRPGGFGAHDRARLEGLLRATQREAAVAIRHFSCQDQRVFRPPVAG